MGSGERPGKQDRGNVRPARPRRMTETAERTRGIMEFERVYAKIYLDRIEENMEAMKRNLSPETMMVGTVKTDAYGHGAVPVAKIISPYVSGYAVATAEEALELRENGIEKAILVLGVLPESQYEAMIRQEIRMPVFELARARRMSEKAVSLGRKARVHIAVDTGMSRIGLFPTEESAETVKEIAALPGIEIEGMFTHFAQADETDKTAAQEQLRKFQDFIALVKEKGVHVPVCHCSNSAGILDMKEANLDAVRAGITIYGLYPSDEVEKDKVPLKPAMELKSFVTYIKEIGSGTAVSYGGTFVAERPMRVATVSVGYGDGYPRSLSGRGYVLISGKKAPILGRVCMDQMMVDVTDIPEAREGSEVTLLGRDGELTITMEELADLSGGFHYELLCLITRRVPRVYSYRGRIVGAQTCFRSVYEEF